MSPLLEKTRKLLLPIVIFLLIFSVCGFAAYRIHHAQMQTKHEIFAEHMDRAARMIEEQASEVLRALESVGAVASLSETGEGKSITRDFHDFMDWTSILEIYPQMEAVALAIKIDAENSFRELERFDFDPSRRKLGYGPLKIFPQRTAPFQVPLVSISPIKLTEKTVGFDVFSHPVRREIAERARDRATTQIGGRIVLLTKEPGVLLMHPFYDGGAIPATAEERRKKLHGFVISAYATSTFLNILKDRIEQLGLEVEIHGLGAAEQTSEAIELSTKTVLSSSFMGDVPFEEWRDEQLITAETSGVNTRDIVVGGQRWRVVGRHAGGWGAGFQDNTIFLILGFGFIFAALAAVIVYLKTKGAEELTRRVHERTEALNRSRQDLIASQARYYELAAVAEKVNDGMVIMDLQGRVIWCNPSFERATGFTLSVMFGKCPHDFVHGPETDQATVDEIGKAIREQKPIRTEIINYNKCGMPIWVDLSLSLMRDEKGKPWRFSAIWRDVTEQKKRSLYLESVLKNIDYGVSFMDLDLRINVYNQKLADLFKVPAEYLEQRPAMRDVIDYNRYTGVYDIDSRSDEEWDAYVNWRLSEMKAGDCGPYEMRLGTGKILLYTCIAVGDSRMTTYVDITEIKDQQKAIQQAADALRAANKKVKRQATVDDLTGIANRRSLTSHLEKLVAGDQKELEKIAILNIDLDRFKHINDTLGHAAGDFVLQHTAKLLQEVLGRDAFVARMGGDEFVAIVPYDGDTETIEKQADAIVSACSRPVVYEGRECRFGASVGVALSSKEATAQDLLINSDLALYRAKNDGRGQSKTFTRALEQEVIATKELADDLLRGLEASEFEPYFQPQYFAENGGLAGAEALARWRHPERGILSPAEFLHVAEDLKIVSDIDQMIFEKALNLCIDAENAGVIIPKMSVNVSFRRLADPHLHDNILKLPKTRSALSFELLESIFFDEDHEPFTWNIDRLRELGIGIEIDDFGSGRASIIGLMKVGPDRMKIDRQLVRPIDTDPAQRLLVKSIVTIGHSLNIGVTAEGVENQIHADILTELGCDVLQGFHFSKPLPKDEFLRLVLEPERQTA